MAKKLTKEQIEQTKQIEKSGERFVGDHDEFEFIGMEDEVTVIEVDE